MERLTSSTERSSRAEIDVLAQRLALRDRQVAAMEELGGLISDVLSPDRLDSLLDLVVARSKDLVHADVASLNLLDTEGCQTVRGSSGIRTDAFRHIRVPRGVGVDGWVLAHGQPKRVADYRAEPAISHELDALIAREGVRAVMSVPFFLDGQVGGTINVARRRPLAFSQDDETLLVHLASQAAIAVKIVVLWQETRRLESEHLQALHERLLGITRAKDAERRRVARELHDDLGQTLSALVVNLDASRHRGDVPSEVSLSLEACSAAARGALSSVRTWLGELRIPSLETIDLAVALRDDLLPSFEAESGCEARLVIESWPAHLPGEVTFNVYRVLQEALANVRRHAQARRVLVRLSVLDERLVASVMDDGIGMPEVGGRSATDDGARVHGVNCPDAGRRPTDQVCIRAGFGLIGMRERAALLGGELRVHATPGAGTTVLLSIPRDWSEP